MLTLPLTAAVCAWIYTRPKALTKLLSDDEGEQIDDYTSTLEEISK